MPESLPRPRPEQLGALAPLAGLSAERLAELAQVAVVERARRGSDPLKERMGGGQSVFLIAGELLLAFEGGGTIVVVGGSEEARVALNRHKQQPTRTKAITDVDLVALDDEVLDILTTWDEAAAAAESPVMGRSAGGDARIVTGAFGLGKLRAGAFSQLPVAHIDELLKRFARMKTGPGEVVIREGDEGEHYYVIEAGRFQVERLVGGARVVLAELKSGDAFGEEALVSEAKRNATVTSLGEGDLLRLERRHFDELLREPLLRRVSFDEASGKVGRGALWLDVRYPSEYQYDRLPGAINVPLAEVRNMFAVLDRGKEYIVYCHSGRRSAAAAFLFAQRGFKVWLLDGGLRTVEKSA
jgi:rhodanese-related sulfurtransferase